MMKWNILSLPILVNILNLWKKLYSNLSEKKGLRRNVELLHILITTSDKVEKYADMMKSSCSDNFRCHYVVNKNNRKLISIMEKQRWQQGIHKN